MSSFWDVTFAACGELGKLAELKDALPSHFHAVTSAEIKNGVLIGEVAENYGGSAATEAMIHHYPDISFTGMMMHRDTEQNNRDYHPFRGYGGQTEWQRFKFDLIEA